MRRSYYQYLLFGAVLIGGSVTGCTNEASSTTTGTGGEGGSNQGGTGGGQGGDGQGGIGGGQGGIGGGQGGGGQGGIGGGQGGGGQGGTGGSTTACTPGETQDCYTGPAGTQGVGVCASGTETCAPDGSGFGPCEGEIVPAAETCATMEDDDCDGLVNEEGAGCVCVPGQRMDCYSGPMGTEGVGTCVAGTQLCKPDGTGYDVCLGQVLPAPETCLVPNDEDCDGQINEEGEGCMCVPGAVEPCYTGPMGTAGVGACAMGTHTCNMNGTGYGACMGEILPTPETCNTPQDDDCDGTANEGGAGCVCMPNSNTPCYTGPAGTQGVGICMGGIQTCNAQGTMLGACVGEVVPLAMEDCMTPGDDNCNGQVNEGCGPPCMASTNVVTDGGFETGPMGTAWTQTSTNFGTPLCDQASCGLGGGSGSHAGTYWAWFGGALSAEEGTVSQPITIQGGTATLTFFLEVPIACDSAADYLEVTVDGAQVFLVNGNSPLCGVVGYSQQTVNLTPYADGNPHTLTFHSETFSTNGASTSFFVDDIVVSNTCP